MRTTYLQGQEPSLLTALGQLLNAGLEVVVLLLAFTLAIFVILVFAVRALMVFRKLPVPVDPLDMVKPKEFRALMLGAAVLLTPLVARNFLPLEGTGSPSMLMAVYLIEIILGLLLWLAIELFYKVGDGRTDSRS
jgi:hypothetical protein